MSKQVTTSWYVGAWVVAALAVGAMIAMARAGQISESPPTGLMLAYMLLLGCSLMMLVMFVGAMLRLAALHAWGWFTAVLLLQLCGLGILGMLAYALSGPSEAEEIVVRPRIVA